MGHRSPQLEVLRAEGSLQRWPSDADSPAMTRDSCRLTSISDLLYSKYAIRRLAQ